jgi:hypothetical protein
MHVFLCFQLQCYIVIPSPLFVLEIPSPFDSFVALVVLAIEIFELGNYPKPLLTHQ